ncbi:hypothetical protein [Bdellovibrio svalbardensis]|uniref:Uncharacterized protein n=1 Tax=Bdellovibrio svalbardensis TaxID=2972972 RepID=A0ABT6DLB1_9BACT|nr:hypothetical protein [Bdellovibrio svalbardensis]MDG0817374.1 hypothetical protein [Bdellovibrio svalbardensis]
MDGEKILIQANVSDERRSDGFVYIETFNQTQKMQVALRKLALFWGLAILSILIPVFHFVLVPLFFALGFFFAHRGYKSEGQVLSGSTTCPHCHTEVVVRKAELNWPITEICQGCARVVRIEKA